MAGRTPWNADLARQRIQELLHLEGALLPILHALQEEFGCIDEAAEPLIAAALNCRAPKSTASSPSTTTSAGRRQGGMCSSCAVRKPARRPAPMPWPHMPRRGSES